MFILMPFRPVTRGRLKRARFVSFAVFLSALALYALMAIEYAFPGRSAALITFVSGLDVIEVPARPLLRWMGGMVTALSFATLPFRLNLCSGVAAALILAWLYKIAWFFVFESMREESAVTHAARIARFAALCVTLCVGVSLPFMYAATRFNAGIFDTALIIGAVHLLCVYSRSTNLLWLLLFGVMAGISAAESPLFIAAAPLLLYLAVITEWKQSWCRITRLTAAGVLAAVAFALTHWLSVRAFLISVGDAPSRGAVFSTLIAVFREQMGLIGQLLPRVAWFLVIAFGAGFALITVFAVMRSIDNRRSWMLFVIKIVLSVLLLVILFNWPPSVWQLSAGRGVMPVFSYVLACSAIGLLMASWRAQAVLDDPRGDFGRTLEDDEDDDVVLNSAYQKSSSCNTLRVCGVYAAPVLGLLVVVSGLLNLRAMLRDDGSFMDSAAQQLVTGLGERRWVVSNGLMDSHILIQAHQLQRRIHLLSPYRVRDRQYGRSLLAMIAREPAFSAKEREWAASLVKYNLFIFINDFFMSQKNITEMAVCMGLPDIWYDSKKVPVPEILFYGGAAGIAAMDAEALISQHAEFFESQKSFFSRPSGMFSKLTWGYRVALLRHLAFVANNLGVTLDDQDLTAAAFQAYAQALEIYPDNISALLNQFDLVSRGLFPEKRDLIEKLVNAKVANATDRYPLWALNRHFGYVRNYELFVNMGWEWAISSSPGSVIAGLRRTYAVEEDVQRRSHLTSVMAAVYEMQGEIGQSRSYYEQLVADNPRDTQAISGLVRLSLQSGGVDDARLVLERGLQNGVSAQSLRKDWAALYLMAGDLPRARTLLQAVTDESEESTMAVAMLAMVMIEQGEFAGVESKILPKLIKMERGAHNYFVHVIQGRVYQMKGRSWYAKARQQFMQAFALRPDVGALREIIFRLDLALEDRSAAEAHAIELLRINPAHPMANFFMGSVALEAGDYGRAEEYLKRSAAEANPTVEALNNYAQLLCRIKRTDQAVRVARQAVAAAPERYEVWSTLAYILQEADELEEASKALSRASTLNKTDKRLFVIDGLIALKRGDLAAVKRAVAAVEKESAALPVISQRDLQILRKALDAQR